jgi:hypothetical protein
MVKIKTAELGKKKGQLKIQQMSFMLMAVTLFFILVGMLVLVVRLSGLKETARELEEKSSLLLVSKLANSPEFSCGNAFGAKVNCVDLDKITNLKGKGEYENFWDVAYIEIRTLYPKEEVITVFSRNVKTLPAVSNFVTICRKESIGTSNFYDKCELAKLIVSSEDKTNG